MNANTKTESGCGSRFDLPLSLTMKSLHQLATLDQTYVGTSNYMGIYSFWSYDFRHIMRAATPTFRARVHDAFIAAGLPVCGSSDEHVRVLDGLVPYHMRDDWHLVQYWRLQDLLGKDLNDLQKTNSSYPIHQIQITAHSVSITPVMEKLLRQVARIERIMDPTYAAGGFVIIFHSEIAGWTCDLSRPDKRPPGCWAVPESTNEPLYVATGGDDMRGATAWSPVAVNQYFASSTTTAH